VLSLNIGQAAIKRAGACHRGRYARPVEAAYYKWTILRGAAIGVRLKDLGWWITPFSFSAGTGAAETRRPWRCRL